MDFVYYLIPPAYWQMQFEMEMTCAHFETLLMQVSVRCIFLR